MGEGGPALPEPQSRTESLSPQVQGSHGGQQDWVSDEKLASKEMNLKGW